MTTSNNLPSMLHHRTLSNLSSTHEDLFSSITGLDDLAGGGDDDLSYDDIEDSLLMDGTSSKSGGPARKGKNRNGSSSTAEKKATHNAVERARRESLNARFLVLADMLPGMTQVKRASKAAIVNKSIDLIREMQLNEHKLAKENELLKAELEALRLRTGSPSNATGALNTGATTSSNAGTNVTNANIAALAAAQEVARQQVQAQAHLNANAQNANNMHQQALFGAAAGMHQHPMQHLGMPMMSHIPAAAMAASIAAAAANNPALLQQHHQHSQAQQQQQQQQQQQYQQQHMNAIAQQMQANQALALAAAASASASTSGAPQEIGSQLFPGFFNGMFNGTGAPFDALDSARSESGSPASHGSFGSQGSAAAAASQFAHGLFDLPSMTAFTADNNTNNSNNNGSPTGSNGGAYNQSPPGTVASLAGSERTHQSQNSASSSNGASTSATNGALTHNGSAPSPASSNGVPTPPSTTNAYSPIGLSHLVATPQSTHSQANVNNAGAIDPVIAAFDGSSDAAYLAAQFAPNDLAKAQLDLQAFIAYQSQRMSFAPTATQQQPHTPTLEHGRQSSTGAGQMSPPSSLYPSSSNGAATGYGFASQQQQQQGMQSQMTPFGASGNNPSLVAGMCGPSAAQGMNGMPAWQMMMAQHQAMVAAYGGQQF